MSNSKSIEKIIRQVNGSMAIEGMPLTVQDKAQIRKCAAKDGLTELAIAELVKKHTQNKERIYKR